MNHKIDLTGKRFGRLIVIRQDGKTNHGDLKWLCKCDCGNTKSVIGTKLKNGWTKSCGCLQKEWAKNHFSKHNMSDSRLYSIWSNMKDRCYNSKSNRFYCYGGKGIKICDEWLEFSNFSEWALLNGYKSGLTIERKNINGNYEPDNCCWITPEEQARNKSNTVWVIYKDKKMCMSQFAREMGVSVTVIRNRIKRGLTGEQIAKEFINADSRR